MEGGRPLRMAVVYAELGLGRALCFVMLVFSIQMYSGRVSFQMGCLEGKGSWAARLEPQICLSVLAAGIQFGSLSIKEVVGSIEFLEILRGCAAFVFGGGQECPRSLSYHGDS